MSLISDALKKAQRARSPDVAGGPGGGPRRATGVPMKAVIAISAGGALLVSIVAFGIVAYLRHGDKAALAAAKSVSAPPASNTATAVTPPPPLPATVAPAVAESSLPAARNTPAAPAPVSIAPPAGNPRAPGPVPPMAPSTTQKAVDPEVRIQSFIDGIQIRGFSILSKAADNKVMLRIGDNEKVYRINEIVDRDLNLRLITIDEQHLTFVDANGVTYTKRN